MQTSRDWKGKIRSPSLKNSAKKLGGKTELERLQIPSRKLWRYQGNISYKDEHNKGQKQQGSNRSRRD